MLKQMIEYVDIEDKRVTRTIMFNLTRFEVEGEIELERLQERFQRFQDEVIGDDPNAPIRDMTGPEKREILAMVKEIIRHSYGVKEGSRFMKSQDIWDEFEQTGAFSAFIYYLFEQPERVNAFMSGIWPQGVDRPQEESSPNLRVVDSETSDFEYNTKVLTPGENETQYPNVRSEFKFKDKLEDYSPEMLIAMPDPEFDAVLRHFSDGKNVPLALLQIGMQRNRKGLSE